MNNINTMSNINADVVNDFGKYSTDFVIHAGTLEKYTGIATNVMIPDSVTIIGSQAFLDCEEMTNVVITDNVTKIGDFAFSGCAGLTSVTIPNSVTEIGEYAFSGCTGLTSVTIPNSVTKISDNAFHGCKGLTNVTIPGSVTEIGNWAFGNCLNLVEVSILGNPAGGPHIFLGCQKLEKINASEEWKRANWTTADCLKSYAPHKKSGFCYIATAVYGSYNCPQVWVLRRFRDHKLAKTWYGRLFIRTYYALSPTLVRWFGEADWFQRFFKRKLDRIVRRLKKNGFEDTYYEDKSW